MDTELIDTCWNVNVFESPSRIRILVELIDTCWNVNQFMQEYEEIEVIRINRYMLECK